MGRGGQWEQGTTGIRGQQGWGTGNSGERGDNKEKGQWGEEDNRNRGQRGQGDSGNRIQREQGTMRTGDSGDRGQKAARSPSQDMGALPPTHPPGEPPSPQRVSAPSCTPELATSVSINSPV